MKPFALWFGTTYAITSEGVVVRSGVFRTSKTVTLITEVTTPHFKQSLIDKVFGSGKLTVTDQMTLDHVPHVEEVQDQLLGMVRRVKRPGVSAAEAAKKVEDVAHRVDEMKSSSASLPAQRPEAESAQPQTNPPGPPAQGRPPA